MYGLKVRIRRVIENDTYPERVECFMTDYEGQTHFFEDKLPVFTAESDPMIPGDGVIRCTVLREMPLFVEVDTSLPDGVESTAGRTVFSVSRDDLTEDA